MDDETQWQADRANLRHLHQIHPEWTKSQLAQALNRSVRYTGSKKWLKRLKESSVEDKTVRWSVPRNRKQPPPPLDPVIEERILFLRDNPPENLKRTPGPRALLYYYLDRDAVLKEKGLTPPRSTATIWKILVRNGRIGHAKPRQHKPMARPEPLTEWQIDYKDCSTIQVEPDGKKQHIVEVLNVVDVGSSILLEAEARPDYNAETALETMASIFERQGLPVEITFDRDPRWVGSASGRDFPAAFVRFLHCLDVKAHICPPHRPDMNGIVERYNRSYGSECLSIFRPINLEAVREVTEKYKHHYNYERPHQSEVCGNVPPRVAFPALGGLRSVPLLIDPDSWLMRCHGQRYMRKINHRGVLRVDKDNYYVSGELTGKYIQVELDGLKRELVVYYEGREVKRLPIKGLQNRIVGWQEYVEIMKREAQSEKRLAAMRARAQAVQARS
jgi:transposase InsO family protein